VHALQTRPLPGNSVLQIVKDSLGTFLGWAVGPLASGAFRPGNMHDKDSLDSRVLVTMWLTILWFDLSIVWLLKLSTSSTITSSGRSLTIVTRSNTKNSAFFSPRFV
jgi:hypothetical protein